MKNINWIIAIAFTLSFSACKDDNNCTAGTGGNLTIVAYVKHHDHTIIINHVGWPDTVFVKFNAQELPGTSPASFDTFYVGEVGEDHVHLEGLQCGDYFLYAVGIDSTGPYRVTGGSPFSTTVTSGEVETTIQVSE